MVNCKERIKMNMIDGYIDRSVSEQVSYSWMEIMNMLERMHLWPCEGVV